MGIASFFGGGAGKELVKGGLGLIKGWFPQKLSKEDEKKMEMQLLGLVNDYELKGKEHSFKEQQEFNKKISDLEGTAKDLKTIPFIGAIVIFLRGVQRPFWGFGTFYFDYTWFETSIGWTDKQEAALLVINFLVLTFLFGERAIINALPLLQKYWDSKSNAK